MFNQIAPQRAQHSLGFIVQVGNRYSIQYLERDFMVEIDADLSCTPVPLFIDTLTKDKTANIPSGLTSDQAEIILSRIKEGLDCLGVKYEVLHGKSP